MAKELQFQDKIRITRFHLNTNAVRNAFAYEKNILSANDGWPRLQTDVRHC